MFSRPLSEHQMSDMSRIVVLQDILIFIECLNAVIQL